MCGRRCIQGFGVVGIAERCRPLGRPRLRFECNIILGLKDKGWECVVWMNLALDRFK